MGTAKCLHKKTFKVSETLKVCGSVNTAVRVQTFRS
jgi:hypothetical protein